MKKFVTIFMLGTAMALTACAATDKKSDYSYETQAPYSDERTVGETDTAATAEHVFQQRQRK